MRVLVVEDNLEIARQIKAVLLEHGYAVDLAPDGREGKFLGESEPYDAVILDLGLPQLDGLSVLRQWRQGGRTMPVLILTARDAWTDKVDGLNAGADDYLVKPFVMAELLARINALVRRSQGRASAVIAIGELHLDTITHSVSLAGLPVRLTAMEYGLLAYLAHHAGRPVSKTELTEHLYQQDFDRDSNTLEVLVARLRKKLGDDKIETLRGQGYRMLLPGAPQ
ncbi:response regulator transcription factor [Herminiimonas sp. CN]|uniref:response regulator n=1 Tax=Herminiimonas sp. CN TaxID=1349818 RepID=UPI0004739E3C|nr:response regulator transcription factor [Herminiimonas sp. CN]